MCARLAKFLSKYLTAHVVCIVSFLYADDKSGKGNGKKMRKYYGKDEKEGSYEILPEEAYKIEFSLSRKCRSDWLSRFDYRVRENWRAAITLPRSHDFVEPTTELEKEKP